MTKINGIITYPHATSCPLGAYAQAMTHVVGILTACSLLVVKASHIIIFPSCQNIINKKLFDSVSLFAALNINFGLNWEIFKNWKYFFSSGWSICYYKNFSSNYLIKDKINDFFSITWEEETMCRLSGDQSEHNTFAWWPFKTRRGFKFIQVMGSSFSAATGTANKNSF